MAEHPKFMSPGAFTNQIGHPEISRLDALEDEVSLGEDVPADELGDALGEPGGGEEPLPDAVVVLDAEVDALDDHLVKASLHPHKVPDVVEEGTFDDES